MNEQDWEKIFRRIKCKPQFMKNGRPTSALFKDSHGVSVNRDCGREINDIIADEERLHRLYNANLTVRQIEEHGEGLKAIISLTHEQCDSEEVCVIPDPIDGENAYHALLQKSATEVVLSSGQARRLAKMAVIEKTYDDSV